MFQFGDHDKETLSTAGLMASNAMFSVDIMPLMLSIRAANLSGSIVTRHTSLE